MKYKSIKNLLIIGIHTEVTEQTECMQEFCLVDYHQSNEIDFLYFQDIL